MSIVVVIILILLLCGGGVGWSRSGYAGGPWLGGGLGLVLLILLIMALFGGNWWV